MCAKISQAALVCSHRCH